MRSLEELIAEGIRHDDPYVRAETARLVGLSSAPVAPLRPLLDDSDPLVSLVAADAILRRDASDAAALSTLRRHLDGSSTEARLAVLDIARREVSPEQQAELLSMGLAPVHGEPVRQSAANKLVALLRDNVLPAATARSLERDLTALATDPDEAVAATALAYLGSISRLAGDYADLRKTLQSLLQGSDIAAQERALRIFTLARDSDLAALAFEPYTRANTNDLQRLREVAAIALGQTGDTFVVSDLEAMGRRDAQSELQCAALAALTRIDTAEARQALGLALQDPSPKLRQHVLRALLEHPSSITVPENVLRAPELETRVLGLKVLYAQDADRFRRIVTQKLEVESFRAPLLEGLAAWADESPLVDDARKSHSLPWLTPLAATLDSLRERVSRDDPTVQTALYQLLGRLQGSTKLLERWSELPLGAQYALLRQTLELGERHGAFDEARRSSWFVVELLGALGQVER